MVRKDLLILYNGNGILTFLRNCMSKSIKIIIRYPFLVYNKSVTDFTKALMFINKYSNTLSHLNQYY